MESAKLPNNATTEELLKSLEQGDSVAVEYAVDSYHNDVLAFFSSYGILPGEHQVNKSVLRYIYKNWSNNPITYKQFVTELGKFFAKSISGGRTCFNINQDAFTLSTRAYKIISKNTRSATKSPKTKEHFENFIKKYDIKKGTFWIEARTFFYLYDKWTYTIKKKNPIGYLNFLKLCRLYFPVKKNTGRDLHWVGLDNSITKHIPKYKINSLRKARKVYADRRYKR